MTQAIYLASVFAVGVLYAVTDARSYEMALAILKGAA